MAEKLFNAADTNNDGVLDTKELQKPCRTGFAATASIGQHRQVAVL